MAEQALSQPGSRGAAKTPRSRAFFLEMLLNMLLFALCATVLVQVFAQARITSDESSALTQLSFDAQNLAEHYKATGGDLQALNAALGLPGGSVSADIVLSYHYDSSFAPVAADEARYRLVVTPIVGSTLPTVIIEAYDNELEDSHVPLLSYRVSQYQARGVS
jgi:hypothetical protein